MLGMDGAGVSKTLPEIEKDPKATIQDWLNYLQSHKKMLADGNNVNLILYYVIGTLFVVSLLVAIFFSQYIIAAMFGLAVSVILLGINSYTRASNQKMIDDIDGVILKILMNEITNSDGILNEMQKVFKKEIAE
jgi:hypothetical protein